MYATDRQTDRQTSDRQTSDAHHRLMPPTLGAGHNNNNNAGKHCAFCSCAEIFFWRHKRDAYSLCYSQDQHTLPAPKPHS